MASSFSNLSKESRALLGIPSFLVSEDVPLKLLEVEALLSAQLITQKPESQNLSCSSTIASEFRHSLPLEERQTAFNNASELLHYAFLQKSDGKNNNQLYQQWTQCKELLPHVLALNDHFVEEHERYEKFIACFDFCELLQHCQRYLYETHSHTQLSTLHTTNLAALRIIPPTLNPALSLSLHASILSHRGNILERTGDVHQAFSLNQQAYKLRLQETLPKISLLAGFEQNLDYCYDTANEHETALQGFEKAKQRWVEQGKDCPAVTKMNMGRCLVYLGRCEEAGKLLDEAVGEFRAEEKEGRANWAMLAYAYFAQGILLHREKKLAAAEAKFLEARDLWLKGDQTREHPFHAGCLYKLGVMCLGQGKKDESISHLCAALEITKVHADHMPVEHARALLNLAEALGKQDEKEAEKLNKEAMLYLRKRDASASAQECDQFVPIFWR